MKEHDELDRAETETKAEATPAYHPPQLRRLGQLRDLTQGSGIQFPDAATGGSNDET